MSPVADGGAARGGRRPMSTEGTEMSTLGGQGTTARGSRRRTWFGRNRKVASACLIAVCLLLASGRIASIDGSSQLAQAVHFCATGNIGAKHRIAHDFAPKDFHI